MFDTRDKPKMVESALLIGCYFTKTGQTEARSLLDELRELVGTLGISIADAQCLYIRDSNKRYLMGKGKAEEMMELAEELGCDCIIFDNELSPSQQRAWEEEADITTIDRQEIILDIFNMRAQTKEARLQVELARMEYSLPRLARMWGHLGRQRGGSGGGKGGKGAARGEGEQQIEVDRRIARKRINNIKRELAHVRRVRDTQRKERLKTPVPTAALVGYTNVGKSSLLNKLTGADVFVEDQVFATLDPTTRRIGLPDGQSLLLTDTVGFVRNLPHRLIEAFKATLEEAILADFLVHVLDAASPDIYDHHKTTLDVLHELGAQDKKIITVVNKIDLLAGDSTRLHQLKTHFPDASFISVETGESVDALQHRFNEMLLDRVRKIDLCIPQSRQDLVALIHREGKVLSEDYDHNDVLVKAVIPARLESRLADFTVDAPAPSSDPATQPAKPA